MQKEFDKQSSLDEKKEEAYATAQKKEAGVIVDFHHRSSSADPS